MAQSKGLQASGTIKRTARERHNQKDCQEVAHPKGLQWSGTIKRAAREPQLKEIPGSATIRGTARK